MTLKRLLTELIKRIRTSSISQVSERVRLLRL